MEERRVALEESRYLEGQKIWMENEDGQAEYLIGDIPFNVRLGSEN